MELGRAHCPVRRSNKIMTVKPSTTNVPQIWQYEAYKNICARLRANIESAYHLL